MALKRILLKDGTFTTLDSVLPKVKVMNKVVEEAIAKSVKPKSTRKKKVVEKDSDNL